MAENNLTEVTDGEIVAVDDINQSVRALKGNVVPRNAEGVATNQAGSLGTPTLGWEDLHVQRILLAGEELEPGAGGGAAQEMFANGVVSGEAPTGRPGMCGWMNQAGTAGVRLSASAESPLVVRVGGEEYRLEAPITGGTPPAAPSTVTSRWYIDDSGGYDSAASSRTVRPFAADETTNQAFMLCTGRRFNYANATGRPEADATNGNTIIMSFATQLRGADASPADGPTEIMMFDRAGLNSGRPSGYRAIRDAFNIGSSGYQTQGGLLQSHNVDTRTNRHFKNLRTGYIFVDPTTNPWTISIRTAMRGSVYSTLPSGTEGDLVYRELNNRWMIFTSGAWVETSLVFIGIAAVDTVNSAQAVIGVQGVRSEAAIQQLFAIAERLHSAGGDWDSARSAWQNSTVSGDIISFDPPDTTATEPALEVKRSGQISTQQFQGFRPTFSINTADPAAGSRVNSRTFVGWVDAVTGETFFDQQPPMLIGIEPGKVFFAHPHRNAAMLGTFSIDSDGSLIVPDSVEIDADAEIPNPTFWIRSLTSDDFDIDGRGNITRNSRGRASLRTQTRPRTTMIDGIGTPAFIEFDRNSSSPNSQATVEITLPTINDLIVSYEAS